MVNPVSKTRTAVVLLSLISQCALLASCVVLPPHSRLRVEDSQTEVSRSLARRFLLALAENDATTVRAVMAQSAYLTLPVAGVYAADLHAFPLGTRWKREDMLRNEAELRRNLDGPLTRKILSLIAEGDQAVAEVLASGVRAANHRGFWQHYSFHFLIRRGQIVDIRLYEDTFEAWDVWDNPGVKAQHPFYPNRAPAHPMAFSQTGWVGSLGDSRDTSLVKNKEAVRSFLEWVPFLSELPDSQLEAVRERWAPDGFWCEVVGSDQTESSVFVDNSPCFDREAMLRILQMGQRQLQEPLTLEVVVESMVAENDQVSVEAVAFDVRDNGRAYRQHYSIHFSVHDGTLYEGRVYQDTLHLFDVKRDRQDGSSALLEVKPSRG